MKLGLGTGSTAGKFVDLLGAKVKSGLKVVCVPTSEATRAQAAALGIPLTTLVDHAGDLYGTTPYGGINNCQGGCGIVFELTPSGSGWTEQVLYRFDGVPDAQRPYAGLIIDSASNLYGASFEGGTNGGGAVFELSPNGSSWNYSVLYDLTGSNNGPDARLAMDSSGNLYGTTIDPSTAFELSPSAGSWAYTNLHNFSGNDGIYPRGSLAIDRGGNLYGTTSSSGADQQGTAWEIAP